MPVSTAPWKKRRSIALSFTVQNDDRTVATVYREADANLIVAAPEMLAALREADEVMCSMGLHKDIVIIQKVRAAIAKATGGQS